MLHSSPRVCSFSHSRASSYAECIGTEHLAELLLWEGSGSSGSPPLWMPLPACLPRPQHDNKKDCTWLASISVWGGSQHGAAWVMSARLCTHLPHGKQQLCSIDYGFIYVLIDRPESRVPTLPFPHTSRPSWAGCAPRASSAVLCLAHKSCWCAPQSMQIQNLPLTTVPFGLWEHSPAWGTAGQPFLSARHIPAIFCLFSPLNTHRNIVAVKTRSMFWKSKGSGA